MLAADGDLSIRLMVDSAADYDCIASWLSDPQVLEYYEGRDRPFDRAQVERKFGPRALGEESVTPCIMEMKGAPIGYAQFYPLDEETLAEYQMEDVEHAFGFDIFIGEPGLWNRGLGTRAVQLIIRFLFEQGAQVVTADPRIANPRAVHVYEKAGMRNVGRLPTHEFHEGEWQDCWLMMVRR